MKIVSLEWFEQSLERGMALDESLYLPTMPVEERGQGAWDRRQPISPAVGKRTRDAESSQALNPFRRKLRRSASTKLGSQSDALWAGITAPSFERQIDEDEWTEDILAKQQSTRASTRTHTPASPNRDAPILPHDALSESKPRDPAAAQQPSLPVQPENDSGYNGIFQGRLVCPHGFDAEKVQRPPPARSRPC
jgi:DNA replication regulator DPB11